MSDTHKAKLKLSSVRRSLWDLFWPRRGLFGISLILILINRVTSLVLPASTKYLIDDVVVKRQSNLLLPIVAAVAGAAVVQAITYCYLFRLLKVSSEGLIADMKIRAQRHICNLPVRYYDVHKTGALLSRIMSDADGLRNLLGTGLVELGGGLVTAIIAIIMLLRINTAMTIGAVVFLSAFAVVMRSAFGRVRVMFRERGAIHSEVMGRLSESLSGVRIVKGFRAEEREALVFESGMLRIFENIRRTLLAQSSIGFSSTLFSGLFTTAIMVVGGRMLLTGAMTVGDFVSYSLLTGFVVGPVVQIAGTGNQFSEALAGLDRVHEVLCERTEHDDPSRTRTVARIKGDVRFEEVYFEYEAGKPVLRYISLHSPPGTITALVGRSGSGKSTLISLVAGFDRPVSGRVLIDDIDASTLRLDSFRSGLGIVLQDNFLFAGTIKENILFGCPTASDEEIFRAAHVARVDEFALRLENKYDTVIGERGVKLSGGQRQRVAIARAVLADPRILILDEATSNLDAESESLIQEGLSALMKGRTTFVIAHRLSTIRSADQILVLDEGRIVEWGTHRQLIQQSGPYFQLYSKQAGLQANRFRNLGEDEAQDDIRDSSVSPWPRALES